MEQWRARLPDLAIGIGLVAASLLSFAPSLRNGFVNYDDQYYLTENPIVQHGLAGSSVAWAFTTTHMTHWHPLTWLSIMLDVELFGLNPWGHHFTSLLLHALNTVLAYAFMRRLRVGRGSSAFAAGLFGLHPLRAESVAWVAERKDVLSMAFGLFTLLAYIRYARAPARRRMAAVALLLGLGLMAKSMLMTLPFVLLLLDWWPLGRLGSPAWVASPNAPPGEGPTFPSERRSFGGLVREKSPLFALVSLSCGVAYLAQATGGLVMSQLPLSIRLANAVHSYVAYLRMTIFPDHLAAFYPLPERILLLRAALDLALLGLLTFAVWRMRTRRPYLLVGWLWYLGTLIPMIGLVQVGLQGYADRYTYLPSLGLALALSLLLADTVSRLRLPQPVVIPAAGTLLAFLGALSWRQTLVWHDPVTLWEHTVTATRRNSLARMNLAAELIRTGDLDRADAVLEQALAEGARAADVRVQMSEIYDRKHQPEQALREIDAALELSPDDVVALLNRAIYLTELRRDAEAIPVLKRVFAMNAANDPRLLALAQRTLELARTRLSRAAEGVQKPPETNAIEVPPR
jgi:tetratricopeptide (TPR) repeat protein